MYTMSNGSFDKYLAIGAEFAFSTNEAELAVTDVEASLNLFEVNDDVDAVFSNFDDADFFSPSLTWLGLAEYSAPDTYTDYSLDLASLTDANTGAAGIKLKTGTRYFLTMSYADASNLTFHAFNSGVVAPFISTILYTDSWGLGGFEGNPNAVLRLYITLESSTDNKPLPVGVFSVSPNPVRDVVSLKVDFDKATDATITIADVNGRVILIEDKTGLNNERLTYNLPQLASGTYLARIATAEGTRTLKFVVAK
jgi:Secretion system C-terminal sorting domain